MFPAGPQLQALDRSVPAGPQLQALDRSVPRRTEQQAQDQSVPRRTSTASARSQCPPDPNSNLWIRVFLAHFNCKR